MKGWMHELEISSSIPERNKFNNSHTTTKITNSNNLLLNFLTFINCHNSYASVAVFKIYFSNTR